MKKSELIEMLSKLDGDPELLIWNSFVGDWHDVQIVKGHKLVKHSLEHLFKGIKHETMYHKKSFKLSPQELKSCYKIAKQQYDEQEWEFPNSFVEEERHKDWYGHHQREIVLLQGKVRGKSYNDRLGSMDY